eukprot:COSAG01_NODE_2481_length_7603_cov_4.629398_3_plen_98_part_00
MDSGTAARAVAFTNFRVFLVFVHKGPNRLKWFASKDAFCLVSFLPGSWWPCDPSLRPETATRYPSPRLAVVFRLSGFLCHQQELSCGTIWRVGSADM